MAKINSEILSKSTNKVIKESSNKITLEGQGNVVKLKLSPNDIESYSRDCDDLIIKLKDGSTISIANFYKGSNETDPNTGKLILNNELILDDSKEVSQVKGLEDATVDNCEIAPLMPSHEASWPVILGSIAASVGVIAALVASASGSSSSSNSNSDNQLNSSKAKQDLIKAAAEKAKAAKAAAEKYAKEPTDASQQMQIKQRQKKQRQMQLKQLQMLKKQVQLMKI